eukprot:Clim_evm94s11 gene=Clim_evmTU94s11
MSGSLYQLSRTLQGHEQDVRCCCGSTSGDVATGSRDQSVRLWTASDGKEVRKLSHHQGFVYSVSTSGPADEYPSGVLLTTGQDKLGYVFDLFQADENPLFVLIGHSEAVCSSDVYVDQGTGQVMSATGSWDCSAKVWDGATCIATFAHQLSVWDVCLIPAKDHPSGELTLLTACADKMIRRFSVKGQTCVQTYAQHDDAVRGLVHVPGLGFASCSNDAKIVLWAHDGAILKEFHGHTSFIYSIDLLPDGLRLVSGGEDRTMRLWDIESGNCTQIVHVPAVSVWCVSALKNGDIVQGSSDGLARIFTQEANRIAPAAERETYEASLKAQEMTHNEFNDIDFNSLPGFEALSKPGEREGQTKLIKQDDKVVAYQWLASQKTWQEMGQVVDSVGQKKKQLYNGKEYDYVFDVDIGQGRFAKLPVNSGEDPYKAAERFIKEQGLTEAYLEQIVEFVKENAKAAGGGPTITQTTAGSTQANHTPLPPKKDAPIPNMTFVKFSKANFDGLLSKYQELEAGQGPSDASKLVNNLMESFKAKSVTERDFREGFKNGVIPVLKSWPTDKLFPVIDFLRIALLEDGLCLTVAACLTEDILTDLTSAHMCASSPTPLLLCLLRMLCNLSGVPFGRNQLLKCGDAILPSVVSLNEQDNRNLALSKVSLLLNYSIMIYLRDLSGPVITKACEDMVTQLVDHINRNIDEEVTYRAMVTLGHIVLVNRPLGRASREQAVVTGLRKLQENGPARLAECAFVLEKAVNQ